MASSTNRDNFICYFLICTLNLLLLLQWLGLPALCWRGVMRADIFAFYPFLKRKKVKVKSLSWVQLFATPWTVAYHTPPSMGFSKQEGKNSVFHWIKYITCRVFCRYSLLSWRILFQSYFAESLNGYWIRKLFMIITMCYAQFIIKSFG